MLHALAAPGPDPVHHLPLATTGLAVAFLVVLLRKGRLRSFPPHILWWAAGIATYGAGTAIESVITLSGNSPGLTRWWYIAGALLGGYPLGTGSVYLLCRRRVAHALTWISGTIVLGLCVAVLASPIDVARLDPHRPGGGVLVWSWIRLCTPFVNLYAAAFLIGGAASSAVRFWWPAPGAVRDRDRAAGTALIAVGGLLPGIGGGLAKAGYVEGLYVGEFLGLIAIWMGHARCSRSVVSPAVAALPAGAQSPAS